MKEKLFLIRTNIGVFASIDYGWKEESPERYMINGQEAQRTYDRKWGRYETDGHISVTERVYKGKINARYVLDDSSLAGDTLPAVIPYDEIERDEDGCWVYPDQKYQPLYRFEDDGELYEIEAADIEVVEHGSYTVPDDWTDLVVPIQNDSGSNKEEAQNYDLAIENAASWADIERLLTPGPFLRARPCSIQPKALYKIIRGYIKDNIDRECAKITSDYDFCFTVKKVIPVKPYTVMRARSQRKGAKKYPIQITHTDRTIFEMTAERYRGYTQLEPITGRNLSDLAQELENYLKEIMSIINAPISYCTHCEGTGLVEPEKARHPEIED